MTSKSRTDVPEQHHDAMRAAAMRPVSGPAATSIQAAGGGNELPGRERHDTDMPTLGIDHDRPHEPIPGEHDRTTLTRRAPGAIGGAFNGEDASQDPEVLMEERTMRERVREGGGGEAERRLKKQGDR